VGPGRFRVAVIFITELSDPSSGAHRHVHRIARRVRPRKGAGEPLGIFGVLAADKPDPAFPKTVDVGVMYPENRISAHRVGRWWLSDGKRFQRRVWLCGEKKLPSRSTCPAR
jgi:hypothetical protein